MPGSHSAIGRDRGYTVELSRMEDSRANGDINYRERRIRVRVDMAPSQQAKTMSHELGHALLEDEAITDRPFAQLMAESIAFMVCAACGIDSSDYRFGYVRPGRVAGTRPSPPSRQSAHGSSK